MAKILYVLHTFKCAGSQFSMLAIAKSMREKGHQVYFVGAPGTFEKKIREEGIGYYTRPYNSFSPLSTIGLIKLARIVSSIKPDILHSNIDWPHIECLFIKAVFNIPVVSTFPAGPLFGKPMIPNCPLISYSYELKDAILKKYGKQFKNMLVIQNRMDLVSLSYYSKPVCNVKRKVESILFISRLDQDKWDSIFTFLNNFSELRTCYPWISAKIIGDGDISGVIKSRVSEINLKYESEVVTILGHKPDVYPDIESSDLVVGLGRCVMEGMFSGKPSLVVCNGGWLSLVTEDNADIHAYYNFAGRAPFSETSKMKDLENIKRLFSDLDYCNKIKIFSKQYVIDNYEVTKIQDRMNNLYEEEISKLSRVSNAKSRVRLLNKCFVAYAEGMYQRGKHAIKRKLTTKFQLLGKHQVKHPEIQKELND